MNDRKPMSKRLRFEIFKRDGFRCVYCGATPLESVMHVDHVEAVALGGENDPANLVTSCASCNLGKGAVPLARLDAPLPDVESEAERVEQLREYLALQRIAATLRAEIAGHLADYWTERILWPPSDFMFARFPDLIEEWGMEKLMRAIDVVAARHITSSHDPTAQRRQAQYFHAILRNWREGRGA